MLLLYLCDRLEAGPPFGRELTPELVRRVRLRNSHHDDWYRELAEIAHRRTDHRWVRKAIDGAILRSRYRTLKESILRTMDR